MTGPGAARARVAAELCRWFVAATDLLPPSVRYGPLRRVVRWTLRPHPVLVPAPEADGDARPSGATAQAGAIQTGAAQVFGLRCALVTGALGTGGVEEVVATLARGLPRHGIDARVFCTQGGRTERELRTAGVVVEIAPSVAALITAVLVFGPEVVELHNAPESVMEHAVESGLACLPVVHNIEIHRSRRQWARIDSSWCAAVRTVAVSGRVGEHHLAHLAHPDRHRVVVVPNGADAVAGGTTASGRWRARSLLGGELGVEVRSDDVVVLCLARYDAQKNIPGLVAAFLRAVDRAPTLRLVVAGSVADPVELARADALRRGGRHGERVHLLGASDARVLRDASDVFVLDSFFEGWSIAASEAAAAGLPVVLSDAGGARELAALLGDRGVVVPNPACAPDHVSERAVRRARRARRQRNLDAVADALVRASRAPGARGPVAEEVVHGATHMVAHHAGLIHVAAATARAARSSDDDGPRVARATMPDHRPAVVHLTGDGAS